MRAPSVALRTRMMVSIGFSAALFFSTFFGLDLAFYGFGLTHFCLRFLDSFRWGMYSFEFHLADSSGLELDSLMGKESSMNSPAQLTGWNPNGGDPCGQSWKGITCSGSSVTEIKLSGLGLNGNVGYQMDKLKSLVELDLSSNNLGGGNQIPYALPPKLQRLNLAQNQFNGGIPYSISLMTTLQYLNLAHNQIQGNLSDMFAQLSNLKTMDLSFNSITGDIPGSFSSLSSLTALIDGNSWSTGPAPPPPPYTSPPGRRSNPGQRSGGSNKPNGGGGGKSSGISGGAIAGIVIGIFVFGAIIAFFLLKRKTRKSLRKENLELDQPFAPLASNDIKEMKSTQAASAVDTATFIPAIDMTAFQAAPLSLKPPPVDLQIKSNGDDDSLKKTSVKKAIIAPMTVTVYSVADLQMATNSFSVDNLLGEGSLGRVYRAQFNDGKVLAVKKINSSSLPNQSSNDFIEVVSNISRLHHPNLSELVGYCCEHGQHLLVYEFHKNGSLHDLLYLNDEHSNSLSWNTRVKIALGTARALEYLHEVCSPSVVHKNFKSANILLDADLNPHLSDCGLACLIPSADHQEALLRSACGGHRGRLRVVNPASSLLLLLFALAEGGGKEEAEKAEAENRGGGEKREEERGAGGLLAAATGSPQVYPLYLGKTANYSLLLLLFALAEGDGKEEAEKAEAENRGDGEKREEERGAGGLPAAAAGSPQAYPLYFRKNCKLDYHNMGSGYNAPEVAMSGQYTLKSDVYNFGVVMLELLTGRKPFDRYFLNNLYQVFCILIDICMIYIKPMFFT
ncbi:Protein strubbelig-receptor family 6 [Apostasia shenzhenica]|uniref:Protein strubbelig-receptor family 6 n=1 Tax=Apostasia shenzhenica TaxID=1088818 RepID=A0A2I0BDG9_9ASPA|nr:Protein strubbelig-receptor family 6 [Apostasia shenzhenica]